LDWLEKRVAIRRLLLSGRKRKQAREKEYFVFLGSEDKPVKPSVEDKEG